MVRPPQKMKEKTPRSKIFELTDKDRALEFLQENKLIASSKKCVCDKDFLSEVAMPAAMSMGSVSMDTAAYWYGLCREVCFQYVLKHFRKLGGPGMKVQVKENALLKVKNDYGKTVSQTHMIVFLDSNTCEGFFGILTDENPATLESVIIENIEPGSILCTKQWPGLEKLKYLGYKIDSDSKKSGNRLREVDILWKRLKYPMLNKSQYSPLSSVLDEVMYREKNKIFPEFWDSYVQFLGLISEMYTK